MKTYKVNVNGTQYMVEIELIDGRREVWRYANLDRHKKLTKKTSLLL